MKGVILRLLICVAFTGLLLYSFLTLQNETTKLRIQLPKLRAELKIIEEENERLLYEIERFENPGHLMQLARRAEFSHLKHPLVKEILTLKTTTTFVAVQPMHEKPAQTKSRTPLAVAP